MKKLKVAIIGCGRISYKHVEAIVKNNKETELVANCDIVEAKAEENSNLYVQSLQSQNTKIEKPRVYTDYKEMLIKEDIDIVAIATESGYHAEIGMYCLNNKKHVIVEKPIALSTKDADDMIKSARENNVKLCVCHQNRFNPAIQVLRKSLEKDRFGKIINGTARILWNRNMNYYEQAPWRGTWKLDGGTLMNQCIHNIDLLQWMMGGQIDTVYAQTGNFLRDIEAEDFGAIVIRFKNGSIGLIEGSACVYPKNLEETLSIFGQRGTVCIGGLAVNKIETWKFEDAQEEEEKNILSNQETDPDSVYGHGHTPLFKDMIDAINKDRDPLVSGEEGKKAMNIILAAYKSQRDKQPIDMNDFEFSTLDMKASYIKY